jgi:hypothetical protein
MDENGHGTLWNSTRMMLMKQTSRRRARFLPIIGPFGEPPRHGDLKMAMFFFPPCGWNWVPNFSALSSTGVGATCRNFDGKGSPFNSLEAHAYLQREETSEIHLGVWPY